MWGSLHSGAPGKKSPGLKCPPAAISFTTQCTPMHATVHPATHTPWRVRIFPPTRHFLPGRVDRKVPEAGAPGRGHPVSDLQFVKRAGPGLGADGSALVLWACRYGCSPLLRQGRTV